VELERSVNVRKQRLDLESAGLEPSRESERLAEHVHRLVDGESRTVGRDLEENSTGLPEVNGLEIVAIQLGSDVEAQ
jgi:hypothetical protein